MQISTDDVLAAWDGLESRRIAANGIDLLVRSGGVGDGAARRSSSATASPNSASPGGTRSRRCWRPGTGYWSRTCAATAAVPGPRTPPPTTSSA
ncbi:hypothetical protein ACFQZC_04825 [Streptacidiphilus monticola]